MIRLANNEDKSSPAQDEIVRHFLAITNIVEKEIGRSYPAAQAHTKLQEALFWINHGMNMKDAGVLE